MKQKLLDVRVNLVSGFFTGMLFVGSLSLLSEFVFDILDHTLTLNTVVGCLFVLILTVFVSFNFIKTWRADR